MPETQLHGSNTSSHLLFLEKIRDFPILKHKGIEIIQDVET